MARHRPSRFKKLPINRNRELLVVFIVCTIAFLFYYGNNRWEKRLEKADHKEVQLRKAIRNKAVAKTQVKEVTTDDGISASEANKITLEYLVQQTGEKPTMALPSPLPFKQWDIWAMDLYYHDTAKYSRNSKRIVLVNKLTGEVSSEGLPTVSLEQLQKNSEAALESK